MKLVKPSIQVREKQWDPRFYLGKLSDHEIKKQFVIKRKMAKRPSSTIKVDVEEKSITMRLYDLQLLWEQCNIPQFHRAYFLQYNDKNIEAILKETTEIKVKQAPAQRMMSLIKGREKCLHFLRNEAFEEHKFSELLFHLRILTINVVEQFRKWRDGLHRSVRWRIDDLDYLHKLKTDTDFLVEHYEQYQRDPYFLWIFKLAEGESVHANYHQITKELIKRIRECEILQLECEYYDMQTNILSRKEAQIIAKYMKEPSPKSEASPILNLIPKHKVAKSVQISENFVLKEYVVDDKKEFNKLLTSLTNDKDIEQSFPSRDDLFELIDYQDSYIIGFQHQTKLHGLCVCLSESNENTKKWIIEQIKLDDIQLFQKLIQNLTQKLNGTEITIKLVHYQQGDKLIDCEQLKQILKAEGFRWKQQTNDSVRNIRYTIYYKKQNYQPEQTNQFTFNFHIHRANLSKLMEQTYTNIQENNHLVESFKHYSESRKTEHHTHTLKLKPTISEERINLLDLQLKLPQFKTEVRNGLKYYRIVQDREVSNITQLQIDGQIVYALATLQTDYWILISLEKIQVENVDIAHFQPTAEDFLIPMIQYTENILDTFNHLIRLQFDHLVVTSKEQKADNCIFIKPEQFYFSIVYQGHILTNLKIQQHHFIKYKPLNSSIQITENIEIDSKIPTFPELRLNNLEPNPIKIKIQNNDCICALDNCSQTRRWIIYSIFGCDASQLKNVIELLITQLTMIDPNIQEVGIDFYHSYENGEFRVNKQLQQQLTSLGFKWKLQINEPHNQTRYTKFLLKLQREAQIVDNIVCQYFCTQESPDVNVQPLVQQFSVFYQTLTQSQLIVKRNNVMPFSKYQNKDIPPEYETDQMFETNINTMLTDCKYGVQNNQNFIVFNKTLIQCTKNQELGLVYFVQLNNIIICLNQLEKELTVDQVTNSILKVFMMTIKCTNDDKEEINEDVGLEFIQFNKTGSNYHLSLSLNSRLHSAIKACNFKVIQKPYFIGIIEPGWFEKHNQMIASMIIL